MMLESKRLFEDSAMRRLLPALFLIAALPVAAQNGSAQLQPLPDEIGRAHV